MLYYTTLPPFYCLRFCIHWNDGWLSAVCIHTNQVLRRRSLTCIIVFVISVNEERKLSLLSICQNELRGYHDHLDMTWSYNANVWFKLLICLFNEFLEPTPKPPILYALSISQTNKKIYYIIIVKYKFHQGHLS